MSNSTPFRTVLLNPGNGVGCRPADPAWVRGIRDRCTARGIPFFNSAVGRAHAEGRRAGTRRADLGPGARPGREHPVTASAPGLAGSALRLRQQAREDSHA
jgi:hypothetical protein